MPFIFPTKDTKVSVETRTKDELFEIFMIEIGQYKKTPEGNIEISGVYISSADLVVRFRDWLKKKT